MLTVDFVNILDEESDFKCQCYTKCRQELTKVTTELKSAMKIVEILKEEGRIDDTPVDKVGMKLQF